MVNAGTDGNAFFSRPDLIVDPGATEIRRRYRTAYCQKVYGDSAGISHVRNIGNSWRCPLGKREYPVDMDAACRLQYDVTYSARLANPADSYTWSCNSKKAHSR